MDQLTIKRGDKHDVKLTIVNAPVNMASGVVKVHVIPSIGGTAQVFTAATIVGNVVTWALDGTLLAGRYRLEVQVTVGAYVVTAPSDGTMELTVLQDLA